MFSAKAITYVLCCGQIANVLQLSSLMFYLFIVCNVDQLIFLFDYISCLIMTVLQ